MDECNDTGDRRRARDHDPMARVAESPFLKMATPILITALLAMGGVIWGNLTGTLVEFKEQVSKIEDKIDTGLRRGDENLYRSTANERRIDNLENRVFRDRTNFTVEP